MSRFAVLVVALICVTASFAAGAQQTVFIVRHADKADESDNPPLSAAGMLRAKALAKLLKDARVAAIYTSAKTRTVQTAEPLAAQLQLPIRKEFTADARALVTLIAKRHASGAVLVVGHSNTVPELLRALGDSQGGKIQIGPNEYDNLFVVVPVRNSPPRVVRLRYGD